MLASQAAILLAKKSNSIFDSYTIRSIWANNGIAGIVSSAGVLPVVMGMWSLQKMHMMEPWIFVLSVATIIVSEFSLYWTHETPSIDQLVSIDYNGWPDSCGGYAPPLIYCADQSEFYYERVPLLFVWQVLNPYCLTVFGLAVISWFLLILSKWWTLEEFAREVWFILVSAVSHHKVRRLLASTWAGG
jgi:hypothetical protein